MENFALIFLNIVFIVGFASCQGANQTKPERASLSTENVTHKLASNTPDTIIAPNAPYSITRNIIRDKNGNLWFATFNGIIKYEHGAFSNITNGVSKKRFFSLLEDRQGNFWFGSLGEGLYYYDGKSFKNLSTAQGLVGNLIQDIYEDSEGKIWIGTVSGISVYDGKKFMNYTIEDGLCDNDVNSIVEDDTGIYWIATRGSACTFDGETFTTINNAEGQTFQNVRKIIKDKQGNIWLAGKDGLYRYDGENYENFNKYFVGNIFDDSKGNIWVSAGKGGSFTWYIAKYDANDLANGIKNPTEPIKDEGMFFGLEEDFLGNIWVGKLDGIYRYNGKTVEYFKNDKIEKN